MPSPAKLRAPEVLLALLGAILLSMAMWPGTWFDGRSHWATDAVESVEPWRSDLGTDRVAPHNRELGDQDFYLFPQLAEVQRRLHEDGQLPHWNTGSLGGVPLDGNPQVALWDPFHMLLPLFQTAGEPFSLWRLSLGLSWIGILRFVICAWFAYLWLRRLGGRWLAAAAGAAFVAVGPYASAWRLHTPEQVFSLIPVVLFFADGLARRLSWAAAGATALALGAAHHAGYPQTSMLFAGLVLCHAVWRADSGQRARVLIRMLVAEALAVAIALPALWPTFEYLGVSRFADLRRAVPLIPESVGAGRVALGALGALAAAVAAAVVLGRCRRGTKAAAVAGVLLGLSCAIGYAGGADGQAGQWFFASLPGHPIRTPDITPARPFIETAQDHIGLVVAVLLAARGPRTVLGFLGLVLAVAAGFPGLAQASRGVLPLLDPTRVACLVPFVVAACLACDSRKVGAAGLRRAAVLVVAFAFVAAATTRASAGRAVFLGADFASLAGAALIIALPHAVTRLGDLVPALAVVPAVLPFSNLQPSLGPDSVYPTTPTIDLLRERAALDPDLRVFVADPILFPGNSLLAYGLPQVRGVDGLEPRRYAELLTYLWHPEAPPARDGWRLDAIPMLGTPLFDLLGARLVVGRRGSKLPPHFRVLRETPRLVVAENPHAAPRAWLTTRSYVMQDDAEQLLARPPTDQVGFDRGDVPALPGTAMTAGRVVRILRSSDRLTIETETDGAAWLVVRDGLVPGWRLDADTAGTIHRAYGAFRCVVIPGPGRHVTTFVYEAEPWPRIACIVALLISATLMLGTLLCVVRNRS